MLEVRRALRRERIFRDRTNPLETGLTKPGEVGDFFTLVSMKSSNPVWVTFQEHGSSFHVNIEEKV
jgi:hypothetical protein